MTTTWLAGIPRDGSGGEVDHQKKKKGISGHMEIEIYEAVHQKSATSDQAGQV